MNQENNQKISDLDRARALREEADLLESRARVRSRLKQLMQLSRDPYYDQYLAQMWKDLESGKATPAQVEQEAQRSYLQYQRRMAGRKPAMPPAVSIQAEVVPTQAEAAPVQAKEVPVQAEVVPTQADAMPIRAEAVPVQTEAMPAGAEVRPETDERHVRTDAAKPGNRSTLEYKVGIHVFGMIGAIFVLVAFVIFGFHFLEGLGQGLSLYGAALVLIICSELLGMQRRKKAISDYSSGDMKSPFRGTSPDGFSGIVTGIGVGGLYIANIVNYLVLHTINGTEAMVTTVLIALAAVFLGRKKNSAWIRRSGRASCRERVS